MDQNVVQVGTVTITAYDASTTYKITIGGVTVSVVGSGGTTTTVATALTTALNACTAGMFAEITWSSASAVITATADTAGTPFTLTTAVSGGTGTIGSYSATTANVSCNDINNAVNWSLGTLPVDTNDIVFDGTSVVPVYWNLGSLSSIKAGSITIFQSYTGAIGLKETNSFGTAYPEYRATEMAFDSAVAGTALTIGTGPGSGPGLVKLNLGSSGVWTVVQYNSGSPTETNRQAVSFRGPSTNTVLTVFGGGFGAAALNGQTATIITANIGQTTAGAVAPTVRFGPGCTLTTVNNNNGTVEINGAATTLNHKNGRTTIYGTGAITTLTDQGGTVTHLGTGTITTLNLSGATLDLGDAGAAITITNLIQMYKGAIFYDRAFRGAYSNGFKLNQCKMNEVTVDIGANRTLVAS